LSIDVLDDFVRARPLVGWNHEVDVPASEAIERIVGRAYRLDTEFPQLISPRQRGLSIIEDADRLPAVEPRIADRDVLFLGMATLQKTEERRSSSVVSRRLPPARETGGLSLAKCAEAV
jgi:hypothetical protein